MQVGCAAAAHKAAAVVAAGPCLCGVLQSLQRATQQEQRSCAAGALNSQLCSRHSIEGLQPINTSPVLWPSVCLRHLLCAQDLPLLATANVGVCLRHLCCCAQDLPLLDLHPARITFASDYFEEMIDTATGLIQAGFMYADDTPTEEVRGWQ